MNPEYNEELDLYMYQKIGYDKLSTILAGVFINPYAATSLREYFATGFTEYFTHPEAHAFLKKISPQLFKKLIMLQNPEELDN
jgi:Mlc titration factor MtfA (ptsG expression regulator)